MQKTGEKNEAKKQLGTNNLSGKTKRGLGLSLEEVTNLIPALRSDFPVNVGEIKALRAEDLDNIHRRRHLESYCRSFAEWTNYEKKQMTSQGCLGNDVSLSLFVKDLILLSPKDKVEYNNVINILRRKYKIAPSKSQIIHIYEQISKQDNSFDELCINLLEDDELTKQKIDNYDDMINEISNNLSNLSIEKSILSKKAVRSQSGVVVVTILTSPGAFSCKHDCHYCPNEPGQPRSYLSTEPAVLRANQNSFDAIKQFRDRSITLKNNGHIIDKIEILVLGGTWSGYPRDYQRNFIRDIYYAANTFTNGSLYNDSGFKLDFQDREILSLQKEIELNENAECRIIGLTLETRPDYITVDEIFHLRELGCTRVQLGIQHTDNMVLKLINRGCYMKQVIKAIRLLKDTAYKVDIHLMPDLPNPYDHINIKDINMNIEDKKYIDNRKNILSDLQIDIGQKYVPSLGVVNDYIMLSNVLSSPMLQCDQWKLYPCEVVPFSKIEEWYESNLYMPYTEIYPESLCYLLLSCKVGLHPWIRINRVIRDIPNQSIIAGNNCTNLRQMLSEKMKSMNLVCRCLRCREIKDKHLFQKMENIKSDKTCEDSSKNSQTKKKLKKKKGGNNKLQSNNNNFCNNLKARDLSIVLRIRQYSGFGGREFFISVETRDELDLYGFIRLRLRLTDNQVAKEENKNFVTGEPKAEQYLNYSINEYIQDSKDIFKKFPILKNCGLIRELHIYGLVLTHNNNNSSRQNQEIPIQHKGYGKTLLKVAEYITYLYGFRKIAVISGIGVREYYGNNGYKLEDTYMIKDIGNDSEINMPSDYEIDIQIWDLETDLLKVLNSINKVDESSRKKNGLEIQGIQIIDGLAKFHRLKNMTEYISKIKEDISTESEYIVQIKQENMDYSLNSLHDENLTENESESKVDTENNVEIDNKCINETNFDQITIERKAGTLSSIINSKYTWIYSIGFIAISVFSASLLREKRKL
ncbi:radical SAM domain-containing protein [Cryptosporidium serpentis]